MSTALLLADDYLFISRIQGHARVLGVDVQAVRTAPALLQRAAELRPGGVLLDLHLDGLKIAATGPPWFGHAEWKIVSAGGSVSATSFPSYSRQQ